LGSTVNGGKATAEACELIPNARTATTPAACKFLYLDGNFIIFSLKISFKSTYPVVRIGQVETGGKAYLLS
jgi:hypothetical protein